MLQEIKNIIRQVAGENFLYLDEEITIVRIPNCLTTSINAVCVGPGDTLWVMDSLEQWYPVDEMKDHVIIEKLLWPMREIEAQYRVEEVKAELNPTPTFRQRIADYLKILIKTA
jgi:hypothetical protein